MSVEAQAGLRAGSEDGIEWKLLLAPLGNHANGYVRLPEGHPWAALGDYAEMPAEVHGGLTYGPAPERDFTAQGLRVYPQHVTDWIGFDTAHYDDAWPSQELAAIGGRYLPEWPQGSHVWSVDALERHTRALARQVAAAARPATTEKE